MKLIDLSDDEVKILESVAPDPVLEFDPRTVPNLFPRFNNQPYRIAIIGEAPGKDEVEVGKPFVGMSGRLLDDLLRKAGIIRDAVFIGNISQHRPPNNDITLFSREGEQIKGGLVKLEADLGLFNPNVVLLLGRTALWAAKGIDQIDNWRGSFFVSDQVGPFLGRKCIASYHPAFCLRVYNNTPLLMMDIHRTKSEGGSPELVLPQRQLFTSPTFEQCCYYLDELLQHPRKVSCDIEGYWNNITCCSFATNESYSFIVPFVRLTGESYWTEEEEVIIWSLISRVLCDPRIQKVWQNGLYDRFCFQYGNAIPVFGNADDTMLGFWEKYCELEKSLGFQCSILTKEPFYKAERKSKDTESYYKYCCKDSCVTYEINSKLQKLLLTDQLAHYRFNHTLLNPLLYMELRGIRYDSAQAKLRHAELSTRIYETQYQVDKAAGKGFNTTDKIQLMAEVKSVMCFKRDVNKVKAAYLEVFDDCMSILQSPGDLSPVQMGKISALTGTSLNCDSYTQLRAFLYNKLGLPIQYKEGKRDEDAKITSDFDALLKLKRKVEKGDFKDKALDLIIELGQMLTRRSMLEIKADPDGKVRTGYILVGTETGRISSKKSPTGSGYNLQTITSGNVMRPPSHPLHSGLRDLFLPDPGYHLFQCDLSGADGWTVGAYMAMLGDTSMLDDLRAGIKPAARICYMLRHGDVLRGKPRAEVKELLKEVKKESWDYFACKQGIWGTCYTMGPDKLASTIAKKSQGLLWMSRSEVKEFQNAVFSCYRVRSWHTWMGTFLTKNNNTLVATNGFRRKFYGRSTEVLGQALAHLPQVYTTYATNKAMYNLWCDTENRRTEVGASGVQCLRIIPLHQVHDALIGQFRIEDTDWAVGKIKSYFANQITIAQTTLTIPFEGTYGDNWAFEGVALKGKI